MALNITASHGVNVRPIWGQQVPDGPHIGPMSFAIGEHILNSKTPYQRLFTPHLNFLVLKTKYSMRSQYHSCWYPGSLCHQAISNQGTDNAG